MLFVGMPTTHFDVPSSGTSRINVSPTQRWISGVGGGLLLANGLRQRSLFGMLQAALGVGLLFRGTSGHCPITSWTNNGQDETSDQAEALEVETSVTIDKSPEEVYRLWRNLRELPRFMRHLESVEEHGETSTWVARAPAGMGKLKWEAEITTDQPGRRLAWRSVGTAPVDNAGEVTFQEAPGKRGTEVKACIAYRPPAGDLGRRAGKAMSPAFRQMVHADLKRFKQYAETGEVATTDGQTSGRRSEGSPISSGSVRPYQRGEAPSPGNRVPGSPSPANPGATS